MNKQDIFLINERYYSDSISPYDIFSFYYCEHISDHPVKIEFLKELKEKYVNIFRKVLQTQLNKYHRRQRIDPEFNPEHIETNDLASINQAMNQTYRSDMVRRNDNWNLLAEYVYELSKSNTPKRITFYIDRIHNTIHNTGEIMLSKLGNARELMNAFNVAHTANINALRYYSYPELKNIENVI